MSLVADLPPGALFLATLAYGVGVSIIYHLHNSDDRFQDSFLATGITIGLLSGTLAGQSAETILLRILPGAIISTLSLSAFSHRLARTSKCIKAEL